MDFATFTLPPSSLRVDYEMWILVDDWIVHAKTAKSSPPLKFNSYYPLTLICPQSKSTDKLLIGIEKST